MKVFTNFKILFVCSLFLSIGLFSQTVDTTAVDGQIFVKIKDGSSSSFPNYNGTNDSVLSPDMLSRKVRYGITKIYLPFSNYSYNYCQYTYLFKFSNIDSVKPFINSIDSLSYVEYAEKVPILKIVATPPNDPYFNSGVLNSTNWHLKRINAENAWNISTGSSSVAIAIIDNEIDQSHPDLSGILWTNPGEIAGNGIDDDANGYIDDVHGWDMADGDPNTIGPAFLAHGTHCAGLAGAQTNNSTGISSIGNGIRIMPLKATSDIPPTAISNQDPSTIDVVAAGNAINYAVNKMAKVISLSFGSSTNNSTFHNIISNAISHSVTIVAAAGNSNLNTVFYPAGYSGVISVGASDYNDKKATFSNYGSWIDVVAPGTNIWSTYNTNANIPNHLGYEFDNGTSMAAPLTAGLCGLLLSINPALTPAQVKTCIKNNADNIDALNPGYTGQLGAGRINASKTLLCASNQNAFATSDITSACTGQYIHISGISNATGITGWSWAFSSSPTYISGSSTSQNPVVSFSSASAITVTLSVTTSSTTYTYSQTNFLNINTITANLVSTAAGTLCNGSMQQLVVNFQNGTPPFNYAITSGLQTFSNTTNDYYGVYTFQADPNHTTYTINNVTDAFGCQSNPGASLTFTIANCCANLITNGDFEQGNTNVNSDNTISCSGYGSYAPQGFASVCDMSTVAPNTTSCADFANVTAMGPQTNYYYLHNNVFTIDGRVGATYDVYNAQDVLPFSTPTYTPGYTSRLWYQNNVALTAGDKYNVDFFFMGGGYGYPLKIKLEIRNSSTNALIFSSPDYINPGGGGNLYATNPLFNQYSFLFDNSSTGTNYTGNVNVNILQEDYFGGVGFDFAIDDISIRKTNTSGAGSAYAGPDLAICSSGGSVQLSGSGGPTYSWTPSTGLSSTSIAQPTANPTVTTTYTLTTTNAGCGTTTDQVLVTVSTPTISVTPNPAYVCPGQYSYMQVYTNAVNGIYTWYPNPNSVNIGPYYNYAVDYPTSTTSYTTTVQIAGTCSATTVTTVTVLNSPLLTPLTSYTACYPLGVPINVAATSGSTYTWTPNPANLSCYNCASPNATPSVTTIYTVAVTNTACPTTTGSGTLQVYVLPLVPAATVSITPNPVCSGGNATITVLSPDPGITYGWYTSSWGYLNNGPPYYVTPTLTTTTAYNVTSYSAATGCSGPVTSFTVNVVPNPTVSITGTNIICLGSSTLLTATGANSYTWNPGGIVSNTISVSPTSNTTYSVVGTNTVGGCTGSNSVLVTVIAPSLTVTGSTTICQGNSTTLTATGANTYTWYPGGIVSNTISISPSSSTTYTLVGTSTVTGCSATMTVPITVNPPPVITISGTTTICAGASTTLTASGASHINWSTGAFNTPTISVSPVSTSTYSASGISSLTGCFGTGTITVTVNTLPTLTITCSPSFTVCSGTTVTVTASGANTYSWSTGPTTPTVVATVTATISGYVIGTNTTTGCSSTKTATITVNPLPTLTVTPSAPTICYAGSETLTATGASTYSWTPATGLSCTNCSVTVTTLTNTLTYTLTGTSAAGCVNTKTVTTTVTSNSCSGTQPSYTISSSTGTYSPTTGNGFINQNMYIGNGINTPNYTITCTDIRIAPNVSIIVAANATLTISGSWLHACASCNNSMWQGIVVKPGGTLNINNYSIIEDAVQAIYTQTNTASGTSTNWQINSSIFNKNGTNLYVDANNANLSSNNIYNTIFTCRNLTSHSVTSATFTTVKSSIAAATPLVPGSNTPTVTLAGTRTATHINLNSATNTAGTNIGNSIQGNNIFDYADNGIVSGLTPITVKNNSFINFTGSDCNCYGSPNPVGVGIYVSGASWEAAPPTVIIGNSSATIVAAEKNYFTNCLQAINIYDCQNVYINNNTFNNETTSSTFTVAGGSATGEFAVIQTGYAIHSGTATATEQSLFCNNTVNNYATGYWLDFGKLYNPTSQSTVFYNNTISAAGTNTLYCNKGIYIQQSNTYGAASGVPQDALTILTNSITNVGINAISVSAVNTATATTGFVTIDGNTELSVKYNSAATTTVSPHIAAVYVAGSTRIRVTNNPKIQCTSLTSYSTTNAQYIAGIYMATSPSSTVDCNVVNYVGEGYVWEGSSVGSQWYKNKVQHSRYGLVLRNSGIMGDQGSSGHPVGNIWGKYVSGGTDITDAQTLTDNSNPGLTGFTSKIFGTTSTCSGTTTYLPCQNNGTNPYSSSTLSVTTGNLPCVCIGDCGTGRMAYDAVYADSVAMARDSMLIGMVNGIENGDPLPVYNLETRWALQYYISSQNDSLNPATGYENAKLFAIVDGAISGNDYNRAQSILNTISPTNTIENNWQTVDNITIKLQNDSLDSSDLSLLHNVAIQCPLIGGNIVYNARAILNHYYGQITNYSDNCNDNGISRFASVNKVVEKIQTVTVYPNPNSGNMTFKYKLREDAHLDISDLNGRLVGTYTLSAINNSFEVKNEYLKDGVYFYKVTDAKNTVIKTGKIIVMQ